MVTPQADGRRWVKETHTDHLGKKFYAEYLAPVDFDYETCMNLRAGNISIEIDQKYALDAEAGNTQVSYRKIRQDAFFDRFTTTEALKIQDSNDKVIKFFEKSAVTLKRPYINLDHPQIQYAIGYLRDNELLDGATLEERQVRAAAILIDGTIGEL